MRVMLALLAWLVLAAGVDAQDDRTAERRAVALHRIIFNGEPDGPRTQAELEAMSELALAYLNGTGVTMDVELACGFAEVAAHSSEALMPDTPTARRASEVRALVCSEVRDIAAAWRTMGCPTFNVASRAFEIGPLLHATVDRSGIHIDAPSGRHDHELGLTCGEIIATLRHRRVPPPAGTDLRPRDFIELTTWLPKFAHNDPEPERTLSWRLIELRASDAEPARETLPLLVEPEWAWPTPPVPDRVAAGATLRMLTDGQVRWRFDGAPELGTGLIEAARR
jgi:hypothetical protein